MPAITGFTIHLVIVLTCLPALYAQNLSLGVVAGTNLTGDFRTVTFSSGIPGVDFIQGPGSKTALGGPSAEWNFTNDLSVEVDALYRPLHAGGSAGSFTVVTWEFPILAKYGISLPGMKPFVEAGPSFRTIGNLNGANPSHYGISGGLGAEMHWRDFAISPEVRYTRWAADARSFTPTLPNEVEFLLGFSRRPDSNLHPLGAIFSVGVIGGTNLSSDVRSSSGSGETVIVAPGTGLQVAPFTYTTTPGPKSAIVGPSLELHLPKDFSIEADVLYRSLHFTFTEFVNGMLLRSSSGSNASWEFPVLAKYRFALPRLRPFVELGPSFRLSEDLPSASHYGTTAGLGIEGRAGRLKIAPGFRYTRWAPQPPPSVTGMLRYEVEFLTAFTF